MTKNLASTGINATRPHAAALRMRSVNPFRSSTLGCEATFGHTPGAMSTVQGTDLPTDQDLPINEAVFGAITGLESVRMT